MKKDNRFFICHDRVDFGVFTASGLADAMRTIFLTAGSVRMRLYTGIIQWQDNGNIKFLMQGVEHFVNNSVFYPTAEPI